MRPSFVIRRLLFVALVAAVLLPWAALPYASGRDVERSAPRHWAYLPIQHRIAPAVDDTPWCREPLDRFVLEGIGQAGLEPSPEADAARLIRRVYLDLTGLPPSPEEVDAVLADRHPAAYERLVDRLLASPQYGPRWARPWLDAARYADSNGFQADQFREVWPYRDWVIAALNADLPFDRFTIEQLAGDLLPQPTLAQRIATGFHRQATCNVEAGVDPEENRVNQVIDRVNTTATVWLGSTIECAQCHDHPYDPFTQVEYYQLFAFFNNTPLEVKHVKATTYDFYGPKLELAEAAADHRGVVNQAEGDLPPAAPPTTLVMVEMPQARETFLLRRGNFLNPDRPVMAGTPEVLPPPRGDAPANRLGLAEWIVDPANPLTPRVAVNRWWAEFFGHGIVRSVGEFGSQGEPPTHPRVLDALARELIRSGWSRKSVQRRIVTSAVYRQSSRASAELLAADPENRLLARGPRVRLAAEMIRDNALAISGLLSLTAGGPPIFPPQPEGIWRHVGRNAPKYDVDEGENRFRRGVYVVWRRSAPFPGFVTFDAPDRSSCVVRRSSTNTPLQALALLNDSAYVEMAWGLARHMAEQPPIDEASSRQDVVRDRLRVGFRRCVARQPSPRELDLLHDLYATQLARYAQDTQAAEKLVGSQPGRGGVQWGRALDVAEKAAWFCVANALLNLDETITKG